MIRWAMLAIKWGVKRGAELALLSRLEPRDREATVNIVKLIVPEVDEVQP